MADPSPETRATGWAPWTGPALLAVFLLALALIPVGPGWLEFWNDPRTRYWHLLLAAQPVLWVAAVAWGWRPLIHRSSPWAREKSVPVLLAREMSSPVSREGFQGRRSRRPWPAIAGCGPRCRAS